MLRLVSSTVSSTEKNTVLFQDCIWHKWKDWEKVFKCVTWSWTYQEIPPLFFFFSQSHMLMSSQLFEPNLEKGNKSVIITLLATELLLPHFSHLNHVTWYAGMVKNLSQIIYISCLIHVIVMKQILCKSCPSMEVASSFFHNLIINTISHLCTFILLNLSNEHFFFFY